MDRLKTFLFYAVIVVAFFILSEVLIYLNLNSVYDRISLRDYTVTQVAIKEAKATLVNGYVKGTLQNKGEEDLNGKYLKIDFYSSMNNVLGTKYISISGLSENEYMDFEVHFKLQDIESYSLSIVEEAGKEIDDSFYDKEISAFTKFIALMGIKLSIF